MNDLLLYIVIALLFLIFAYLRKNIRSDENSELKNLLGQKSENIENSLSQGFKFQSETNSKLREELSGEARENRKEISENVNNLGLHQGRLLKDLSERIDILTEKNEEKIAKLGESVEQKLKEIRQDNNIQLEKMRETVDEKLQKTLESRLGEAFKQVSNLLESVHKDMGEMKNLATGVGDLKKVLTNVKTKGDLGEYQLENILEQILAPEQFAKQVYVNPEENVKVDFAIKLPGKDDEGGQVWLPIDSKFPLVDYENLLNIYEGNDKKQIESFQKKFATSIKNHAKSIKTKYISPPNTTDFAIMFLPIEGLYAEIARDVKLFNILQTEYQITIVGPTNLAALLNSLSMGFRTLAIEKRSSEVWNVLGEVKKEFRSFGGILEKAKKNLQQADNHLDNLIGTRSRAIDRKLKDVEVAGEDYDLFEPEEPSRFISDD
jgi:DNA recombination protein RmuC